MKVAEKLVAKHNDIYGQEPVTIAFLGDSVTHGCFEVYFKLDGRLETVFDSKNAFSTKLKNILNYVCPAAQINIVNSGISGDWAASGNNRFERDIAKYHPDLVVVGYALNDCMQGEQGKATYEASLESIFNKIAAIGAECIMLTPNLMNDKLSHRITDQRIKDIAVSFMRDNLLDDYVAIARKVAARCNVTVCDVYARWKRLQALGVDTTELLSNQLNHPTREMNNMTAMMLADTILMN